MKNVINLGDWLKQNAGVSPAEARRRVRSGRLKRHSIADLDQVVDEIGRRLPPEFMAELDAIINASKDKIR